jgi:hypothetical protein
MKHAATVIRILPTPSNPDRLSIARVDKADRVVEWLETPGGIPQTTASRKNAELLARRFAVKGNENWLGPTNRRRRR